MAPDEGGTYLMYYITVINTIEAALDTTRKYKYSRHISFVYIRAGICYTLVTVWEAASK